MLTPSLFLLRSRVAPCIRAFLGLAFCEPMAPPSQKRQRLERLIGIKHVSYSGLAEIVKHMREECPEVEPASLSAIKGVASHAYDRFSNKINLVDETTGENFEWELARLDKLIAFFLERSPALRELFRRVVAKARGNPLDICVYTDEVTPGNPMALELTRKFWAFYVSFLQFADYLSCPECWFPIAILRTKQSKNACGGISGCFAELVRSFLAGACNMLEGVVLMLDRPTLVVAKLSIFLADGAAEQYVWSSKGASGIRPCMLCKNVVRSRYASEPGDPENLISVACSDASKFEAMTDADIHESADLLARMHDILGKSAFEQFEKSVGFGYHPLSVLYAQDLRCSVAPITISRYDPMHCLVSAGIAQMELACFFKACKMKVDGFTYNTMRTFLSDAAYKIAGNAAAANSLKHLFTSLREKDLDSGNFRSEATTMLRAYPVIRRFGQVVLAPMGILEAELQSLEGLGEVLDIYLSVKHGDVTNHSSVKFADAIARHLDRHRRAYGRHLKPKHHWTMHLPSQLQKDGFLIDCFALERKHQMVKAFAANIRCHSRYERTVLVNAVLEQARQLSVLELDDRLLAPFEACPDLQVALCATEVFVSRRLVFSFHHMTIGDQVLLDNMCFSVRACALVDGTLAVIGHVCDLVSAPAPLSTSSIWKRRPTLSVAYLAGMHVALPHMWTEGDESGVFELLHAARG